MELNESLDTESNIFDASWLKDVPPPERPLLLYDGA